jgi:hypothetical protein
LAVILLFIQGATQTGFSATPGIPPGVCGPEGAQESLAAGAYSLVTRIENLTPLAIIPTPYNRGSFAAWA